MARTNPSPARLPSAFGSNREQHRTRHDALPATELLASASNVAHTRSSSSTRGSHNRLLNFVSEPRYSLTLATSHKQKPSQVPPNSTASSISNSNQIDTMEHAFRAEAIEIGSDSDDEVALQRAATCVYTPALDPQPVSSAQPSASAGGAYDSGGRFHSTSALDSALQSAATSAFSQLKNSALPSPQDAQLARHALHYSTDNAYLYPHNPCKCPLAFSLCLSSTSTRIPQLSFTADLPGTCIVLCFISLGSRLFVLEH